MPKFIDRTGETRINNQGMKMTIVAYRNRADIDVQFEGGKVRKNCKYCAFVKGNILDTPIALARIGSTRINSQGLKMTLVSWITAEDITVQFTDGYQTKTNYAQFKRGNIANPNYRSAISLAHLHRMKAKVVGEMHINTQGRKMTIIDYVDSKNITVRFDDGKIRSHIEYILFKRGNVPHPDDVNKLCTHSKSKRQLNQTMRVGECYLGHNGIPMYITSYLNARDVSVKFDTGYIVEHQPYSAITIGNIRHPFPYQIGDITMNGPAYIYNNEGNFYCFCNKCKRSDIMTIHEIKDHKCIASDE